MSRTMAMACCLHKDVVFWGWIAACVLLLPADHVIRAAHLFAPPPLPSIDKSLTESVRDSGRRSGRQATVRMAPSMSTSGPDTSILRRLPDLPEDLDAMLRKLPPIEPGMLPPHTRLMPIDGSTPNGADADSMYLLPPVLADESPSELASQAPGVRPPAAESEEFEMHRLPSPMSDDVQLSDDMQRMPSLESALNGAAPRQQPPWSPETIPPDPLASDVVPLIPDTSPVGPWVAVNPPPSIDAPTPPAQGAGVPQRLPAVEPAGPTELLMREYTLSRPGTPAQDAVERHVDTLSRRAAELAARGAYFAARAEVLKALRLITQTLDATAGTRAHSDALGRAMRAFQEACEFTPRGSRLEAELDLALVVSGHRTPVLKGERLDCVTPVVAQQRYLQYAQQQFAVACGRVPAASQALYALARIYTVMDRAKVETPTLCLPEAVALHQAALIVDPRNSQAANELGVLLAGCGQLAEARQVLLHSVSVRPEPAAWHNLSVVHARLGQSELARRASQQATTIAADSSEQPASVPVQSVQWVNPQVFSAAPSTLDP